LLRMSSFKELHAFDKRRSESNRVRSKYSDRIPVICEIDKHSNLPPLDKTKFLVPSDLTMGQFNYIIRRRIKLAPEKAMFLFINNTVAPSAALMSTVFDQHQDSDGFVYVKIGEESVFGHSLLRLKS